MIDVKRFWFGPAPHNGLGSPQSTGAIVPNGHRWVLKQITVTHIGDEIQGSPDAFLSVAFGAPGSVPAQATSFMWWTGPFLPNKFDTIDLSLIMVEGEELFVASYNGVDSLSWLTVSVNGIEQF